MGNAIIDKLITVIITVYNTERYFDRCIKSIMSQTYNNLEIIVVNDASKGNISQLIKEYQKSDSRIRFIENEKNLGLFKARLVGIKAATGDYIAFVDSDDYISFDYYRSLIFRAEQTNAEIVIGRTVLDNNKLYVYPLHDASFNFDVWEGSVIQDTFFGQEYRNYSWHTIWSKLYKTELIKNCIKYYEKLDEHIIMTEDIAFSSVLFAKANRISVYKGLESYYYYQNMNSSMYTIAASLQKYEKCVNDIINVFSFVNNTIKEIGLTCYLENIERGRKRHSRLFLPKNLVFNKEDYKKAIEIHKKFDCLDREVEKDEYLFESELSMFYDYLGDFKKNILSDSNQIIYFDLYNSLITAKQEIGLGKELYDLAVCKGKKIIIVSDKKHDKNFIKEILSKNGYVNYDKIIFKCDFIKQKKKGNFYYCTFKNMILKNFKYRNMFVKNKLINFIQTIFSRESDLRKCLVYFFISPRILIKKVKEALYLRFRY